jgi:hypothetical protein
MTEECQLMIMGYIEAIANGNEIQILIQIQIKFLGEAVSESGFNPCPGIQDKSFTAEDVSDAPMGITIT